ncbi:MAG: cysteine desulfurase [Flavobacteriaceae bacterium]|nr:cysteine desulfurase [Flavobacteriaceae bacterium]
MQKIYLDNAATTPIDNEVIQIITKTMQSVFGNPSSIHQFGRTAKSLVETARKNIANHFNVTASEIVFTSGGGEADNLILINAVANLNVRRIITSKIEHHAVTHTLAYLKNKYNIKIDLVNLTGNGEIAYKHLNELLKDNKTKTMVSLMYVNNEIGTLLDLTKVCKLCAVNEVLFHSDTVQAIGHFKIDLQKTPIDFITASAHKFHGPKGVGFAIIKKGFIIKPILFGGEQERGARAGTENVPSIVGMDFALTKSLKNLEKDYQYIKELKQYFIQKLISNFSTIKFNGISDNFEKNSYTLLNVRFDKELPMLLFRLDLKGIAASGGAACQSGSNKGSYVLNEILTQKETLKSSVRFSFSKYNTKKELDYVITILKELIL